MTYTVYAHTNTITNKSYIGLTKHTIEIRWKQHIYEASKKRRNYKFYNAINKYGSDVWNSKVLLQNIKTFEGAAAAEKLMISLYDSVHSGYNTSEGGDGCTIKAGSTHPLYGIKKTTEHIRKSVYGTKQAKLCWSETRKQEYKDTCIAALYKRNNTQEYTFYHKTYGIIVGYVMDIARMYNVHQGYLRYVVQGKTKHSNGWFLYTGTAGDYSEELLYSFIHPVYGIENLSLKSMCEKYQLSKGNLCMVAKEKRTHTKGWTLNKQQA